jgi:predicted transcriptional regulator
MTMLAKEARLLIPQALSVARKRAGLSVGEVAAKVGITPQTVESHEGGQLPQLNVFLSELEAVGLDFGSLYELLIEVRVVQRIKSTEAEIQKLHLRIQKLERKQPG